jgi:hypothetical protein
LEKKKCLSDRILALVATIGIPIFHLAIMTLD